LRAKHGKDTEVACIGVSGEKLALISCVINNKGRAAGRSGLGAVMGSKKLKAIAVKGKKKVPLFDDVLVTELRKKYLPMLGGPINMLKEFGTAALAMRSAHSGDSPVKNWAGVGVIDYPNAEPININLIMPKVESKYACFRCPIGCGGHMKAGEGEYKYPAGAHKPEYETLAMFGSNCLNNDLDSIIMANDLCNRYGLDTISAGAVIAFGMECYENGLISKEDTGGIELTWGNHRSLIAMLDKVGKREGFGSILADGVKSAAQKIGKGAEKYAIHIQGQEVPAHDPKLGYAWGITYRMDATPARHTQGPQMPPPGVLPKFDPKSMYGRAKAHKAGACYTHFMNSAGMCSMLFGGLPRAEILTEFLNAITGWDSNLDELLKTGERIGNLRHVFNLREGINPLKYDFSGRVMGLPPLQSGPTAGVTVDEAAMDREFMAEMDWDSVTAKPSRSKLEDLGLQDVAKDLWDK
ncbi:MAG TPA: aldehyde ferredoxin oxidoreductase C-terminal domain-containing protein, partial [Dehalococcoidales bacterium]|nr:aldehyde ferredoxin oxidoreductase C-terminal domain-containing protein [Dehalococcoidales bacterium]